MKQVQTASAPQAIGPYSQAIVCGGFCFTSGQIALSPVTGDLACADIETQTRQVMENLCAVLEAAGASPETVVKTTCYLSDMADFAAFNAVYAEFMPNKPARSCVAVKDLPRGALVEVEAVAEVL